MKLGSYGPDELYRRMRCEGVRFRTGPFVVHLRSTVQEVAESVGFCYAEYPLAEEDGFADFHAELHPPPGLRRWLRPQIRFSIDGVTPFAPHPQRLAPPILEWGLNWCIAAYVQQYLTVHAAVVERDGLAAILVGQPGAGKSTLCAGLVLNGWRLLSDEVCIIRPDDGRLLPLARPVSLKNESIGVIGRFSDRAELGPSFSDTAKGTVAHMRAPRDSVIRASEPAMPGWVIFPRFVAGSPTRSRRQSRSVSFLRVADNSFNYSLLGLDGFQTLARLIDACDCYDFRYSDLAEAVERFDRLPAPDREVTCDAAE